MDTDSCAVDRAPIRRLAARSWSARSAALGVGDSATFDIWGVIDPWTATGTIHRQPACADGEMPDND